VELIPARVAYAPGQPIAIEIAGCAAPAALELRHLSRLVDTVRLAVGTTLATFPAQPAGGYGVDAVRDGVRIASTAVDVLERPLERLRYGFASDFAPGRDAAGLALHARRLHLNAIQLYDWMYRHEQLVPPVEPFRDALGQELSLGSVLAVVRALHEAGAQALAYAAVYAVGSEARAAWADAALLHADGAQWQLGEDFLWLVDPADERWIAHLSADLVHALAATGADGFHLDQYGWPKAALRPDGRPVDLAIAFPQLLAALRAPLPDASLIFNNVNDFPSPSTAASPLDASYVEVWPPHTGLGHLGELAVRTRERAPGRPAVLAAYPSVFASAPADEANPALELLLATAFSHGATVLATGESGAVLVDPYYPRHHTAGADTLELLRTSFDLLVRLGDVLVGPTVERTRTHAGGINEEIELSLDGAPVATDPQPGALWLRVVDAPQARVLHLINLVGQAEAGWDTPKRPIPLLEGAVLRLRRERAQAPAVSVASRLEPAPQTLQGRLEGDVDVFELPPLAGWTVVLVQP
jgi:dextranase